MLASRAHRRQRGFGLVEIMVGLVIGLLSVLVVYQVYNVAEGFKRNTTSVGEAQQTGMLSTFVLGMELANAGAGLAVSGQDLASCPDTGNIATSFRPIPVLVTDSGNPATPDSFVVNYSTATTLATTVAFFAGAAAGTPYKVDSPGGFHVGDLVVGIDSGPTPHVCASSVVTAVSAPDNVGVVTLTNTGTTAFSASTVLFNMGPASRAQKVQYSVANGVLFSSPLLDANGAPLANPVCPASAAPQCTPVASNVVNMKVEYGVSTDGDALGLLTTWVQANVGAGFDPATLLPAPITTINQIKAVRIGLIVQGEQFDKTLGAYNWVLFDCAAADKTTCPGRLTGTIAASVSPPGNWRYRVYETIIPLRNAIWNLTL